MSTPCGVRPAPVQGLQVHEAPVEGNLHMGAKFLPVPKCMAAKQHARGMVDGDIKCAEYK